MQLEEIYYDEQVFEMKQETRLDLHSKIVQKYSHKKSKVSYKAYVRYLCYIMFITFLVIILVSFSFLMQ